MWPERTRHRYAQRPHANDAEADPAPSCGEGESEGHDSDPFDNPRPALPARRLQHREDAVAAEVAMPDLAALLGDHGHLGRQVATGRRELEQPADQPGM